MTAPVIHVFFTDVFGVDKQVLDDYGAFNVSLVNDLPLFIDPFLLFNSTKPEYQVLHAEVIGYLAFLRDKAAAGKITPGQLQQWFMFPEVKQTWLGFSLSGNGGLGLGPDFAAALRDNLAAAFPDFGKEQITKGSHLEKVCLISDRVGRDMISDFTTNLIKHYLLEYTQAFALHHLTPAQRRRVAVPKARFNYTTETWASTTYELPYTAGDYVILTPADILTKDEIWINRSDLLDDLPEVVSSVSDLQARTQLSGYFERRLAEIRARDEAERERRRKAEEAAGRKGKRRRRQRRGPPPPSKGQVEEASRAVIEKFPGVLDWFIRYKEDHGDEAEAQADQRVRSSERLYIGQSQELYHLLAALTGFYRVAGTTRDEARARVAFLKDVIEHKGGHRLFYAGGQPIRRESDLQILFRFTWFDTLSDVNREVNNGRGPSDFEVSRGRLDKSLVEFKLASNTQLRKNLAHQAEIYQRASDAQHALKVIVYFTSEELSKVEGILKDLGLRPHEDVILIDARDDNKPSGSKADGEDARPRPRRSTTKTKATGRTKAPGGPGAPVGKRPRRRP